MKLANCINFTHTGNIMKKYMTYFLRVEGNSMEDARIHDGDVLVVDRALEP
ncbi:peptidase, partial [Klebsiella pneumoniae]